MKFCPLCHKAYGNTWSVCLNDNSKLVDGAAAHEVNTSKQIKTLQKKNSFFKIGLSLFPIGLALNILFMKLQVHGILRELSRLAILVGFFLVIFGGIYNLFKHTGRSPEGKH